MQNLISIIVTTLNEEDYIDRCLKALRGQTYNEKEIILVDSKSQDKTVDIARKYVDKVIIQNCIIPVGRNLGARSAKGDILLFVDADVILASNWVETILPYVCNGGVVAVYGDLLPEEGGLKSWLAYGKEELSNFFLRGIHLPCFSRLGTAVAIKKVAFEKVGGYAEDHACCEDVDLALRLREYGKISFIPEAKGYVSMRRFKRTGYFKLSFLWLWAGSSYILTRKVLLSRYSRDFP